MLSVSILGLKDELYRVSEIVSLDVDFIHLDIMDGLFVNDSFMIDENVMNQIGKNLDIHLMVKDPSNYIGYYSVYSPKYITIHSEIPNALTYINAIKNKGIKAGIAINPNTNLNILEDLLPYVDLVLVMSVEPGKGGQKFISSTLGRIRKIKSMCDKVKSDIVIEVDGGLNGKNIASCREAGANMFVVGSYITSGVAYEEIVSELKTIINK